MENANITYTYTGVAVPLASGGVGLISASVVITVLATIWTGLRIAARRLKGIGIQPEDYMVIVALVSVVESCADNIKILTLRRLCFTLKRDSSLQVC